MKKSLSIILLVCLIVSVTAMGCAAIKVPINGNIEAYNLLGDGTWECNGVNYKYRLEITGTMPGASGESTFVYLSNISAITFEQAWKAVISSNSDDFIDAKDAVLVEWN